MASLTMRMVMPPKIEFENALEYVTPMLENDGEKVPIPPSGRSSVVIGMSPKPMVITLKPRTEPSPTDVPKPIALSEMPEPLKY